MNGSRYNGARVVQNGNSSEPGSSIQNDDAMERSDTIIVILVIMIVSLCFFCILWRCSLCDIESNSMHYMTEEEYDQTGIMELGGIMMGGIGDDNQTPSVDLTLDQALSEDESVAANPPPPHEL